MTRHWQPGEHILLREISRGQVWSGRPYTVVEDTPCGLVLYSGAGVRWMRPARPDGINLRMREPTWVLREDTWYTEALRIVTPGSHHSVLLLWTTGFRELMLWYVNLEDPLIRTPIGFDYLDQLLDIEVAADLSEWRWKDEDQYITPPVRAMYVPRAEHRALAVTELVEHEQRVVAYAPKVTVVRRSLLFSMYRTLRTVHVQDHRPVRRAGHSSVHPLSVQSSNPSTLPSWVSTSVSNRLMVLVLAAGLPVSRRPTMIRIVGSWASRSASLVSS